MPTPPIPQRDLDEILAATAPLWSSMRGQRLFLTGGTGFYGCWLLESFLHANRALSLSASVTVLTRSPENFRLKVPHLAADPALYLLAGDITRFVFPPGKYQFVLHAATDTSSNAAEHPGILRASILDGTQRVLDFAAAHGARRLLYASSGAVYGPQPDSMTHIPETYFPNSNPEPNAQLTPYAEAKRAAEQMVLAHAQHTTIECVITRGFAFVGPHLPLDQHFAIGNFIRDALAHSPIRISGDGTPMRSYLYAGDLAIWLWTMLFRGRADMAYNVGSDESISITDLARTVIAALNVSSEIQIAREAVPGVPRLQYVPSIARAREQLGLGVSISLPEAIRRTAAWYKH
jgi:nucleoside-diphosphate-sugar epimerase